MKPKIDWNDSIVDFVRIKVQTPQLLTELVHKQLLYTQKRNYEKKIQQRRELYEEYSKQFKKQQQQFQLKTSFKRQMQKQIAKLALDISKLLKELVKQENNTAFLKPKPEKELTYNVDTCRTKQIGVKQLPKEQLIGEYAVIKQNLKNQIEDLLSRGENLKAQISKLADRKHLIQKDLKRQQGINMDLDQIKKIEQQIIKQREIKIKLKRRIDYAEQSKKRMKKMKSDKQIIMEKAIKRIKDFSKEYKKIMEICQSRKDKKYIQFMKKYRIYNLQQQKIIKYQFEVKRKKKINSLIESINSQIFKYQQPFQKMVNHINRKFTPEQYDELNEKCQRIQQQIIQRQNQDRNLKIQIEALKEHLLRKTKQLQMQNQKIRNR